MADEPGEDVPDEDDGAATSSPETADDESTDPDDDAGDADPDGDDAPPSPDAEDATTGPGDAAVDGDAAESESAPDSVVRPHEPGGAVDTGDDAADEDAEDPSDADASDADGADSEVTDPDPPEASGDGGIIGTPPDDQEMPLTAHIEEMLSRLAIVVVLASLATLAVFPWANDVIIHMWYDVHPGTIDACRATPQDEGCVPPHVYGPLELVLVRIRVAALAGLLVALPLLVYQTYQFMRPGLYPHERRYYLAAVPFSLVLGVIGMLFAYFVVLPLLFGYFVTYSEGSAELAFQLADTMNLILIMMAMLAIIFQIPLLILLAVMMGLTTRRWLERRRLYFWALFLGIAFIFGPDPTGMAPILLTVTMIILFEATLLLLRWTGR